jgi:hypothetical protein
MAPGPASSVYLNHQTKTNMETQDEMNIKEKRNFNRGTTSGRIMGGMVVVAAGVVFLLKKMEFGIPDWLWSWPVGIIAVGLFVGAKHSFRNPGWLVPVLVGSVFLLGYQMNIPLDRFFWPIIIICIGLAIMFKPKHKHKKFDWEQYANSSDDIMDTTTVFGNIKKNIITKDFKGGDVTAVFGGTELNFSRADIQGKVTIDITMVFGGAKLIVPPHWKIQTEDIVTIFGGIEDKRPLQRDGVEETDKVLVLRGTCLFGGIDIKSY